MHPQRQRKANRLGLVLVALFLILLTGVGFAAVRTLSFVSKVSTASVGDNVRSVVGNVVPVPGPASSAPPLPDRVNVLLLGYGGVGHDGADLTDSIMVLSFDRKTKAAAMISVPRDIWVRIPSDGDRGGFWKLNTAYAIGLDDQSFPNKRLEFRGRQGGGNLASEVVGSILGTKIDYWVAVDFHAFKSVVDALGGVDVDVETAFTDYEYPRNDDPTIDPSWMTIHFNAGRQHMNGERAIEYARSRHSLQDGSDFGRSRRQQRLLLAIKEKALSPEGMTKLFGVMDALAADFSTNMTVGQMKTLADAARGIDPSAIDRVSVDDTNYLVDAATTDGQAVLVPRERSWAQLRAAVASLFMDSNIKAEAARVQLWNGSGVPGLAGSATTMLKDMGIQTLPPQNADSMDLIQTEIHDLTQGRDSSTVNYLASLFGAKIVADAPSTGASVDIEVVLGKNYQPPFAGIVDDYDSSLLAAGAAPQPVPSKAASQPKATPVTNDRPKSASTVEAKSPAKPRLTATRTVRSATIRVGLAATPRPTPAAVR